jgi:hypothetical protein
MMKTTLVPFKSKSWGIIPILNAEGHFFTGYVSQWDYGSDAKAKDRMEIGTNAIIEGDFQIDGMSRGRSAANFSGHFRDHPKVSYEFGMQGTTQLLFLIQAGTFPIVDGYIAGVWTFAKQGESVFMCPHIA